MPATVSYPGVYVQELPAAARAVAPAATSVTAFVGWFARGPVDCAVHVDSLAEAERQFGGLHPDSETSYAVAQFFLNGGGEAWLFRLQIDAVAAKIEVGVPATDMGTTPSALPNAPSGKTADGDDKSPAETATLVITAANPGAWGNDLRVLIHPDDVAGTFDLLVGEVSAPDNEVVTELESFPGLTVAAGSVRNAAGAVNGESQLVRVAIQLPSADAAIPTSTEADAVPLPWLALTGGSDGRLPTGADFAAPSTASFWTDRLSAIAPSQVNILCTPDTFRLSPADAQTVFFAAHSFCTSTHSFYLFDIPGAVVTDIANLPGWLTTNGIASSTSIAGATYLPQLIVNDGSQDGRPREIGPSGAIAGIFARSDAQRGVWKAPAGAGATLVDATAARTINDGQDGELTKVGVNALRSFPGQGLIVWGARTLAGGDQLDSVWKYINVRRLINHIEQSLFQSLRWVVFELNDESTWSKIRLDVGSFLHELFTAGALAGVTPANSYFVKCDATTTTPDDIGHGVVNIQIGVAADRPAEFVVLQIQQLAAQPAG